MTETPSSQPGTLRVALYFGVAILLGMAALIPLLAHDRAQRRALETTTETTAVGDTDYLHHRTRGPAPLLTFQGKPLVPPSPRHIEIRDSKMTVSGTIDGKTIRLYRTAEPVPWEKGEVEIKGRPVYFIKVEPGEYLRVQ